MPAEVHFLDKNLRAQCQRKGQLSRAGVVQFDSNKSLVKVSFQPDSQMSSIMLHIQREEGKDVLYQVFANSVRPAEKKERQDQRTPPGIRMISFQQDIDGKAEKEFTGRFARGYGNLTEMAQRKNLLMTLLSLVPPGETAKKGYKCCPVWSRLTDFELQDIRNKSMTARPASFGSFCLAMSKI